METAEIEGTREQEMELMTAEQLARLGVRRLNRFNLVLECARCGEVWAPRLEHEGTLPRGYWQCPNKCNW